MTEQDIEIRRARDLERYHRQTAERRARGLCVKCGKRPPEPGRSECEPCLEKDRAAGRARDARLRAAAERVGSLIEAAMADGELPGHVRSETGFRLTAGFRTNGRG